MSTIINDDFSIRIDPMVGENQIKGSRKPPIGFGKKECACNKKHFSEFSKEKLALFILEALQTEESEKKQWYLEQIATYLNLDQYLKNKEWKSGIDPNTEFYEK